MQPGGLMPRCEYVGNASVPHNTAAPARVREEPRAGVEPYYGDKPQLLGRHDGAAGANLCARTAFDAGVGIDVVDIAFGDSLHGAYGHAGAASNASVGNYVSHSKFELVFYKNSP